MKIKIFEATGEEEINTWLQDKTIEIIYINRVPMFDRYTSGQGDICNQWIDTIIAYKEG